MTHEVIMPALGMAQTEGLLVAWHKQAGDKIVNGDILFEVETDKTTMEVEAQADGFLTNITASDGESVPVGQVIALISDDANFVVQDEKKVENSDVKSEQEEVAEEKSAPPSIPADKPIKQHSEDGRILASPKAKRMALNENIDLHALVKAGFPQPLHAKDIQDYLTSHKTQAEGQTIYPTASSHHLVAKISADGFNDYMEWVKQSDYGDKNISLTAFLYTSLPESHPLLKGDLVVGVSDHNPLNQAKAYLAQRQLSNIRQTDEPPHFHIFDLREGFIKSVQFGANHGPTITLLTRKKKLIVHFEYNDEDFTPIQAQIFLSAFAGRLYEPLRHLI